MIIKIFFLLLSVCMNIDNWANSVTLEQNFKVINHHLRHLISKNVLPQLCEVTKLQKAAVCKNVFFILRKDSKYRDLYVDYSAFKNYSNENDPPCFGSNVLVYGVFYYQLLLSCPARSAIQLDGESDGVNYRFGDNKIAIFATRKPINGSMMKTKINAAESLMFVFLKTEENLATSAIYPETVYKFIYGYENFFWKDFTALKPEELDVTVPKLNENVTSTLLNYSYDEIKQMQSNENNILRILNQKEFKNLCTLILGRWKFENEFLPDEESFPNDWEKKETDVTLAITTDEGTMLIHSTGCNCFSKINSSENSPVYKLVAGVQNHEVILAKELSHNYFTAIELIENVNIEYIRYTMPESQLRGVELMD